MLSDEPILESNAVEESTRKDVNGIGVLYLIPGEPEGANMIFARRQLSDLRANGLRGGVFYLRSRSSLLTLLRERQRLRRELRIFHPDIVHAQFGRMTAFFAVSASLVPVIITYRGSDLNPIPSLNWVKWMVGYILSQVAALRARAIICVSEELRNRLWWCARRAKIIPSGVDTKEFYPMNQDLARASLGWDRAERVIVFNAGRLPKIKRYDLALGAFELVRRSLENVRLHVLDGRTSPSTVAMILNAADCLVFTSDNEGSPNIVKEAMACNLPVVSVDVGDVRKRLDGVAHSAIVDRDPKALAAGIMKVLATRARSDGADKIQEVSLDATSQVLLGVYRSILSNY